MSKKTSRWDEESFSREVRALASTLGHFPTNSELRALGRTDLASQITRRGGFVHCAEEMGLPRVCSDSDFGWSGEQAAMAKLTELGFAVTRSQRVKYPFDLLLNKILRVDVKTARYAQYGSCRGWFYRLGKVAQADLVLLWQIDTGSFYSLPWYLCPSSNITVSRSGGKYQAFQNNVTVIHEMLRVREDELQRITCVGTTAS